MKSLNLNADRLLRVASVIPQFLSVVLFRAVRTESREEQHHGAARMGRGKHTDENLNEDRLLRAASVTPQFLSVVLFRAARTESRCARMTRAIASRMLPPAAV